MADGNGPGALGLIILTGATIAAVVGLYAYDAVPRRDGIAPTAQISWPRWQSNDSAPRVQQGSQSPSPTYSQPSPAYSQPEQPQQQPPEQGYAPGGPTQPQQEQGYTPSGPNQAPQYPQDPRGQNVPYDQQESQGGAGQPPPPDGSPRG
jgi:hypothetical protein